MSCSTHQIRFEPMEPGVSEIAFPCDREGHVDLDAMSEESRRAYLFARATMGRRYLPPCVLPLGG